MYLSRDRYSMWGWEEQEKGEEGGSMWISGYRDFRLI